MAASAEWVSPTWGALPERPRPQLYLVQRGFLFSPGAPETPVTGFAAAIQLSLHRAPFEISVRGRSDRYGAAAIRPMVPHQTRLLESDPLITIGVSPNHLLYRNFRSIGRPGVFRLECEIFDSFQSELAAVADGALSVEQAAEVFDAIVDAVVQRLPPSKPKRGGRCIEQALEMLQQDPDCHLDDLARAVGLSYYRMSLLFSEAVGISLRSFLLWRKLHAAAALIGSGKPLTEVALGAGFVDSAHLSTTWRKVYGTSPTYHFNQVQVHSLCQRTRSRVPASADAERR